MIYRTIVKRKARGIFATLSEGDWRSATQDIADDVHHTATSIPRDSTPSPSGSPPRDSRRQARRRSATEASEP